MLKGNKGEWSEIYVLLRLLEEGKLYAADKYINKIEDVYFPIKKIIRTENNGIYEYKREHKIAITHNDEFLCEIDIDTFKEEADRLLETIKSSKGGAFSAEITEQFMENIGCQKLKAASSDKSDITIQVHDINTGYDSVCGFSIKSKLGNPATLVNASKSTNFIYEVRGLNDEQISEINSIETRNKIADRIKKIYEYSGKLIYTDMNSKTFRKNLRMIDTVFPEMLAEILKEHYITGIPACDKVLSKICYDDPLNLDADYDMDVGLYRYKFKKFLCAAALGMLPDNSWTGEDDATGGYIIVNKNGEVLAYHIYNRDEFEEYLIRNTKFEHASTGRHDYAKLYKDDGKVLIKLNLQIRFE